jgi:protein gp37
MGYVEKISWTLLDKFFEGDSWNPFVGCSKISDGCTNCYAIPIAEKQSGNAEAYRGVTETRGGKLRFTGVINRQDKQFNKPKQKQQPHIFFMNSMSDFFHEDAEDEWRIEAIEIMRECKRHMFELLTKRPDKAIEFFERNPDSKLPENVWLGATVENVATKHRVEEITSIPASVHFLALEPLLEKIPKLNLENVDWVIVGGESGENWRPMKYEWVKDIEWQCDAAGVNFYFKQWGHWRNNPLSKAGGWQNVENNDITENGGRKLDGEIVHEHPSLEKIKKVWTAEADHFNKWFKKQD